MSYGVNRTTLLGNVGADPETGPQGPVKLNLATTRRYKDRDGEFKEETEWHRLTFFGALAELVSSRVVKGSRLYVEGRLHYSSWTDQHDQKRFATEIIVQEVVLLAGVQDSAPERPQQRQQPRQQGVSRPNAPGGPARKAAPASRQPAPSPFQDDDDLPF